MNSHVTIFININYIRTLSKIMYVNSYLPIDCIVQVKYKSNVPYKLLIILIMRFAKSKIMLIFQITNHYFQID